MDYARRAVAQARLACRRSNSLHFAISKHIANRPFTDWAGDGADEDCCPKAPPSRRSRRRSKKSSSETRECRWNRRGVVFFRV